MSEKEQQQTEYTNETLSDENCRVRNLQIDF